MADGIELQGLHIVPPLPKRPGGGYKLARAQESTRKEQKRTKMLLSVENVMTRPQKPSLYLENDSDRPQRHARSRRDPHMIQGNTKGPKCVGEQHPNSEGGGRAAGSSQAREKASSTLWRRSAFGKVLFSTFMAMRTILLKIVLGRPLQEVLSLGAVSNDRSRP